MSASASACLDSRYDGRMWWRTLIVLTVGCGGGADPTQMMMTIDAPRLADAGCPLACTPTAASACPSAQRCTWRVDGQLTEKGAIGCAPSGAIAQNLPCTRDSNGGDNCVSGTTCYMDKCRAICALGTA